jgi:FAD:protein FMN transferase
MKSLIAAIPVLLILHACSKKSKTVDGFTVLKGKTMGAGYEIAYDSAIDLKEKIDFTLGYYSYLLSTYDSNSIISRFNNNQRLSISDSVSFVNSRKYFVQLDSLSRKIHLESSGAFNPGLAALINYWGFGENKQNPENADRRITDSLKALNFGFMVDFSGRTPIKTDPRQRLNFNAIAPGQAADIIASLFDSVYRIKNYYINISGEIRTKGNNGRDSYWPIKIEKPMINSPKQIEYCTVPLKNYSLATSGNYRQFFFSKGKRYGHSIDPRSGIPARNEMLSATILAPSAAEADAYATACMVLGLEKAIALIEKNPRLKAFLIYEKDEKLNHWFSPTLSFVLKTNS